VEYDSDKLRGARPCSKCTMEMTASCSMHGASARRCSIARAPAWCGCQASLHADNGRAVVPTRRGGPRDHHRVLPSAFVPGTVDASDLHRQASRNPLSRRTVVVAANIRWLLRIAGGGYPRQVVNICRPVKRETAMASPCKARCWIRALQVQREDYPKFI